MGRWLSLYSSSHRSVGPEFKSSLPILKPEVVAHACNPNAREAETKYPCAYWLASLKSVQVQWEIFQKVKWRMIKEDFQH